MQASEYLDNIGERMEAYDEVRSKILKYIIKHKLQDSELCTDLFCMGFLHEAFRRDEVLTEMDLAMFLGVDDDDEFISSVDHVQFLTLGDEYQELSLSELLDVVTTKHQC
jgi:hypothetical protein